MLKKYFYIILTLIFAIYANAQANLLTVSWSTIEFADWTTEQLLIWAWDYVGNISQLLYLIPVLIVILFWNKIVNAVLGKFGGWWSN